MPISIECTGIRCRSIVIRRPDRQPSAPVDIVFSTGCRYLRQINIIHQNIVAGQIIPNIIQIVCCVYGGKPIRYFFCKSKIGYTLQAQHKRRCAGQQPFPTSFHFAISSVSWIFRPHSGQKFSFPNNSAPQWGHGSVSIYPQCRQSRPRGISFPQQGQMVFAGNILAPQSRQNLASADSSRPH